MIDTHKVTNGEFLEFVDAGGYTEPSFWAPEDRDWVARHGSGHPHFWRRERDGFRLRLFASDVPLPLELPVWTTHAEAAAYARFRGRALPTEAEWHRAAYGTRDGLERPYPWGEDAPDASRGNFDARRFDPMPGEAHPRGASAFGVEDLLGNGFEWTSTPFAPFPGFAPFAFYPGYSADFFDGRHFVLKGASPRTASRLLRRSFRNWFQPHYPYLFAGFRCVDR